MKAWLKRTARDVVALALGEGPTTIPGGLVEFDVRIFWLKGWPVLSCKCNACGARRSLLLPVRRMALHVGRVHR
jgi:hypothetical protein